MMEPGAWYHVVRSVADGEYLVGVDRVGRVTWSPLQRDARRFKSPRAARRWCMLNTDDFGAFAFPAVVRVVLVVDRAVPTKPASPASRMEK